MARVRLVCVVRRSPQLSTDRWWGARWPGGRSTVGIMHPFELLGEPVRRRIVEILASGEHTAGEVADAVRVEFGISASAVSKHLRILRETDFVIVHYEGPTRVYRLHSEALDRLDSVVGDLFELWDRRIGWRYDTDPLTNPPRRLSRRGLRGVDMRDDPWVMAARAERRPRTAVLDALTTPAGRPSTGVRHRTGEGNPGTGE